MDSLRIHLESCKLQVFPIPYKDDRVSLVPADCQLIDFAYLERKMKKGQKYNNERIKYSTYTSKQSIYGTSQWDE